jgi:hypothetical protein
MSYATISPDGPLSFAWLDALGGPGVTKLCGQTAAQTTQSTAYHNWAESVTQKRVCDVKVTIRRVSFFVA